MAPIGWFYMLKNQEISSVLFKLCVLAKSLQLCLTLCDPVDCMLFITMSGMLTLEFLFTMPLFHVLCHFVEKFCVCLFIHVSSYRASPVCQALLQALAIQ